MRTPLTATAKAALLSFFCGTVLAPGCDSQPTDKEVIPAAGADASISPSCGVLSACCKLLPSEVVSSCAQLAAQAGEPACALEVTALGAHCAAPTRKDAGEAPDGAAVTQDGSVAADASVSSVGCTLLSACCTSPALPASETASCQSVEVAGGETACAQLLDSLTASGSCSGVNVGPGGACPELASCCALSSFPATFVMQCQATSVAGEDGPCRSDLATFIPAGYCGATLADGGHAIDPACATLATCCGEVTFPATTVTTCQRTASANNGGECQSAYDGYVAVGYCQ